MDCFCHKQCQICHNFNGIKAAKASGGHLLEVDSIEEVTLSNIVSKIKMIEEQ